MNFFATKLFPLHLIAIFVVLFSSCKDSVDIGFEEPPVLEEYPVWTHLDGIYKDHDSIILSSCRSSDSIIMYSTAQGVSYFNTRTKIVDKQLGLYSGFAWPYSSIINEYATVYVKDNRIIVHDNSTLGKQHFVYIDTESYLGYTITSLQGDRLYYQHDLAAGDGDTSIWKIRYLDLTDFPQSPLGSIDLSKNEIQIPLPSFVRAHGYINNFWSFDNMLYVSVGNHFYRIDRDGSYKRMDWQGQDIYPGNMFQIGKTLFAVCNSSVIFDHPLLFSNDSGETWQPYTNNDDYGSFDYMVQGHPFEFDNQRYLAGSFGLLSILDFTNGKFSVNPLSFDGERPTFFQSLYSAEDAKFVYAISPTGIWVVNRNMFNNQ